MKSIKIMRKVVQVRSFVLLKDIEGITILLLDCPVNGPFLFEMRVREESKNGKMVLDPGLLPLSEKDVDLYRRIGSEIMSATHTFDEDPSWEEVLPTSAEISKKINVKLELVKKKLRILKHEGLIRSISVSPKRYRFDFYQLKHLEADHPFREIFEP